MLSHWGLSCLLSANFCNRLFFCFVLEANFCASIMMQLQPQHYLWMMCSRDQESNCAYNSLHVFQTLHLNLDPIVRVLHKISSRLTYAKLKLLLMCSMLPLCIFISYCAQVFAIYVAPVKKNIKGTVALESHQPWQIHPSTPIV